MDRGFVDVDGGKLYFEVEGGGTPLVLIHAGFLDNRMWDEQFQMFSRRYKAIRYDVRSFGKSSRPTAEYSDAEDLVALLNYLKVGKAWILGISNGGRIAFDFVSAHPDRVSGLILVAPGIQGYETSGKEEDEKWKQLEKRGDEQDLAIKENRIEEAVKIDLELWAAAQGETGAKRLHEIARDNSHNYRDPPYKLQKSPQPPAFKNLRNIRIPTIVLVGDKDVAGMQIQARRLHELIPGSKFKMVKGADHILNMSAPAEFNRLVLEFLGSN